MLWKMLLFISVFLIASNLDIYLARSDVPGMGFHVGSALSIILAAVNYILYAKKARMERFGDIFFIYFIFIIWSSISTLLSLDIALSAITIARYSIIMISMICLASFIGSRPDFDRTIMAALIAALAVVFLSVVIDVFRPGTFSKQLTRSAGLYINPNGAAQALILIFLSINLLRKKEFIDKTIIICYSMVSLGIFLTLSRSGIVLLVLLTLYLVYKFFSFRGAMYFVLAACVVGMVGALALYLGDVTQFQNATTMNRLERLFSLEAYVDQDDARVGLAKAYLRETVGIFGSGPGLSAGDEGLGAATHNTYIKAYWESGIIAAFIFILFVIFPLKNNQSHQARIAIFMALALGVFTNYNIDNRLFYFLLLAVCATAPTKLHVSSRWTVRNPQFVQRHI